MDKYISKYTHQLSSIKTNLIGEKAANGQERLTHRSKTNWITCLSEDKSGRMSINSLRNYVRTMQPDLSDTHEITPQEYDRVEENYSILAWGCDVTYSPLRDIQL